MAVSLYCLQDRLGQFGIGVVARLGAMATLLFTILLAEEVKLWKCSYRVYLNPLGAMCISLNKQKLMYNILMPSIIAIHKFLWTYGSSEHIYARGLLRVNLLNCNVLGVLSPGHLLLPGQIVLSAIALFLLSFPDLIVDTNFYEHPARMLCMAKFFTVAEH